MVAVWWQCGGNVVVIHQCIHKVRNHVGGRVATKARKKGYGNDLRVAFAVRLLASEPANQKTCDLRRHN